MHRYRVIFRFYDCKSASTHLQYQRYILFGFRQLHDVQLEIQPFPLSFPVYFDVMGLRKIGLNKLWGVSPRGQVRRDIADLVGRYQIFDLSRGITKKVAIDASDGRSIHDSFAYEWSDMYFKTNYWPSVGYPAKVYPLVNGDGWIPLKMIQHLRQMRQTKKRVHLYYWSRLWEACSTSYTKQINKNIAEYQVRLYEALSKMKCTKNLGVILSPSSDSNNESIVKRLQAAGVICTFNRLSPKEFWNHMASSSIAFARPGDHLCVSFRICSFLNLGACIMYDGEPFPQWYQPLVKGRHFEHGWCRMGEDFSLPAEYRYDNLIQTIETLLEDERKMNYMRCQAALYFDRYANPMAVARHILRRVEEG